MSESLRESLEAASAGIAEAAPTEVTPEPVDATPAPEPAEASTTEAPTSAASNRDEAGRFKAKDTAGNDAGQAAPSRVSPTPEGAASSTQPPPPAETTQTEPPKPGEPDTTHAPPSWKLGERQLWQGAPPELRKAVWRREMEMQQGLSRSAPDRALASEVRQLVAPIERTMQARNTTPAKLFASYVQFDQALTSRDPATQAHAISQVMKAYGVSVEALADAIDGKGQPQQRQPSYEEMREQLREEMRAEMRGHQQRAEYQSHTGKVQEFAKSVDPVLFNDEIRHDMAALIESAASRHVELSLQDAYDRAVMANPEARAIVQQREEAKRAATQQQATRRAEAAGSSVKSRPASPVGGSSSGNSLRADLEATVAQIGGRT